MSERAMGVPEVGAEIAGGKYRLVRLLGEGAAGSVFEAEHVVTQKRLAVKAVPLHSGAPKRLFREAQVAGRVTHPNVVDVYDVVMDGDFAYLVMELLEGETLRAYLTRNPKPPIPDPVQAHGARQ